MRVSDEGFVRVQWWPDDSDDSGELSVEAEAATGFAGRGSAWFNESAVAEFAERLRQYQLAGVPKIEAGP